jgi:hypothetical protein
MLPIFPKAQQEMQNTFNHEMFEGMWEASPVLNKIRTQPQREGHDASYQQEDGTIVDVEYQKASVEYSLKFENARGLTPEDFLDRARDIGRRMGREMERNLFATMSRMIDGIGNTFVCSSDGIKFEEWLEMHTKIMSDFDEDGQPTTKTWVCTPEFQSKLINALQEWERDPEKIAAFKAVMAKQKEDYDAREACRRMVD